jgi:hypothetical protein
VKAIQKRCRNLSSESGVSFSRVEITGLRQFHIAVSIRLSFDGFVMESLSEKLDLSRRKFIASSIEALGFYYLFQTVHGSAAWAKPIEPIIKIWIRQVNEACVSVRSGKLSPKDWQASISQLHSKIPVDDILKFVDLEKVLRNIHHPKERLGAVQDVPWPAVEGFPQTTFGHKIFVYRKGSCTPPHAHNHLVSAHLIIMGKMRIRTFDRIKDLEKAVLLKATRDEIPSIGTTVSMSDYRDNVHWFEGISDYSATFDIPVPNIEPLKKYTHQAEALNQIYLNASVRPRGDGLVEAPIILFEESRRLYASV